MDIAEFLSPLAVFPRLKAGSKKSLLDLLAHHAAGPARLSAERIFETVWEREMLTTTGFGLGVAAPHGRIKGLDRMFGLFARLDTPVDYDAIDSLPVDLVFMLLAPEGSGADHLKALARVSRLLRNQAVCEKLRASTDASALYAILTEPAANLVAA